MIAAQKLFYFFDKISYRRTQNLFRRWALSRWLSLRDDFTFCFRNVGTEMLACALPSLEVSCTRLSEQIPWRTSNPASRAFPDPELKHKIWAWIAFLPVSRAFTDRSQRDTSVPPIAFRVRSSMRRNGAWKARPSKGEFILAARELVEGKGGELLSTEYVSAKSKPEVRCKRKHVFKISPDSLRAGKGCPECWQIDLSERHKANRWTIEEMREFARRVHRGDCLAEEPALSTDKVEWVCKHGHKFVAAVCKVMPARRLSASGETHKGTWCPGCNLERLSVNPARAPIPLQIFGEYVKARGGEIVRVLDGQFKGCKSRLIVRCENGHEWDVTGDQLLQKESSPGCRPCLRRPPRPLCRPDSRKPLTRLMLLL